ncbi:MULTISPECIES: S-methyl-5-thioribose-1-phosphate isomerase [Pseudonocardia]|uniref:Methylthioribose-1-phosphate isomerase n=2 Tax=Pseudonocardia TaxID=1847 RepID=A0A1Y2N712_PSEAH|nr:MULTISPECIES: S-methyl-5-thioribose-1-phosphate isomerase [Pseudonocardia]OSY43250.1 Methylthioribose-1-phosphate isomerase [Pseudonocardia autotrophica]TDN71738.1 translation initiation factor 2B subunit I family (IF-2BI) [Pseudonocardia autotrophica]BBG02425.1 methylthioribose-1-phosphate isomerase [Pseudonocardia autotrophica]GEC23239.1 methylthioribose-1-phosphate isomerase [Pseudonocardia saturnea]
MRIVDWADETEGGPAVVLLDQRALPQRTEYLHLGTVDGVIDAVRSLAVRGAPSLGITGAYGVALAAHLHGTGTADARAAVRADAQRIATARPTAVPLSIGVRRALAALEESPAGVLAAARAVADEAATINAAATRRAADLVRERCPDRPLRALTVCNTGPLAAGPGGTALGAILALHADGVLEEVLACETRPLLQGARLTVWELQRAGVPHRLCVDSAGPAAIATGRVDVVFAGADRIAANGDVANKIGTYMLACAAARSGIPFVIVAPEETIDPDTATGADIVVEERGADEVREHGGTLMTLPGTPVYNPAFDVTPHELVTAIVTESRAWSPAPSASAPRIAASPH